jgi:mono/diheme cytochrome c family protein
LFNRRLQVLSPALRIHPTACTIRRRGTENRARLLENGHENSPLTKSCFIDPLADAPSQLAGGVFAGDRTNREPQLIPGALNKGAIASALLGMSSDGSKRAVFAVITADGAVAQAHTERNLDGLAPARALSAISLPAPDAPATAAVTRAGMLFNWVPDRIIYVSDPVRNAILALTLSDDGKVFSVAKTRMIEAPELNLPVDMAPVVPEIANPGFSSNTTLAGTSDIYVVNRGNGTVARITQDGKVVAVRRIAIGGETLGANRLNRIATARDTQKLWLTVSGVVPGHPNSPGAVIEIPAFGPGRAASLVPPPAADTELAGRGAALFAASFELSQGLGPLYNAASCDACHGFPKLGGMGPDGLGLAMRVGKLTATGYDPLEGKGGPIARRHSVAELGVACPLAFGIPAAADIVSLRNAPPLHGAGLIDTIPDEAILAGATKNSGAARGRAHMVVDAAGNGRVGRFGWKADTASLEQFVADAMRNELGLTNPLARGDLVATAPGCSQRDDPNDDGTALRALHAFVGTLPAPRASAADPSTEGARLFTAAGCDTCHNPQLPGTQGAVALYSDLLLHDMGLALDDGVVQGQARGSDWRTTPLWGLGERVRYLHDGRATTLNAAIIAHDGEAAPAAKAFLALSSPQRDQLLGFLKSL